MLISYETCQFCIKKQIINNAALKIFNKEMRKLENTGEREKNLLGVCIQPPRDAVKAPDLASDC